MKSTTFSVGAPSVSLTIAPVAGRGRLGALALAALACLSAPLQGTEIPLTTKAPAGVAESDWTSIRGAYEAGRHDIRATEGGHEARNPGQGWTTKWDGRGFLAQPASSGDGAWQWGLQLESYGFLGEEKNVSGTAPAHTEGQRLSYQWDSNVQEWYVNDQRGVEHGFTVAQRPVGENGAYGTDRTYSEPAAGTELAFSLKVRGGLHPAISPDAQTVRFLDAAGAAVVTYGGLKVWDADGKILPSHFAEAEEASFRLLVDERGARYPLTVDPVAQQEAYLKPGFLQPSGGSFGNAVSVSGNTVVVGVFRDDSSTTGVNSTPNLAAPESGAAYVFVRDASGIWTQQAYLKASNTDISDEFGVDVAIDGNTIVVGARRESSNRIDGPSNNGMTESGAAYVFTRAGTTWTQQAYLKATLPESGQAFGAEVGISGNTIVVGAPHGLSYYEARGLGAVYVFTLSAGNWTQQAMLQSLNLGDGDFFGGSVNISGDTLVVGAINEDSSTTGPVAASNEDSQNAGAAYVFVRSGGLWTQQAFLKASNTGLGDAFGSSVGISGDSIVIGASSEDSGSVGVNGDQLNNNIANSGAAYVFVRSGAAWTQQAYLKASNPGARDHFGQSAAIFGNTVIVGANWEDSDATGLNGDGTNDNSDSAGAAYVFSRNGTLWSQQLYLKPSYITHGRFGTSVAISNGVICVGAETDSSSSTGVNSTPNELAPQSGAAYTFSFTPTIPQISTRPATTISATTATLNCRAFPNYSATTVQYEWGESPSGALTTVTIPGTFSGSAPAFPTHTLIGLLPHREYRFRAKASNGVGPATLDSFLTFTTAPTAPTVTTLAATSITSTSAVLNGTVLRNGADASVYFRYFAPGVEAFNRDATPSPVTGTSITPVSASVTGLLPGTTYTFATRASNSQGDAAWNNLTFTTLPDPLVGGLAEPLSVPVTGGAVFGSAIQPDGRTLIFGNFTSVYGTLQGRMARLLADGSLEGGLGFNPGANGPITCAAVLADGKIMIGGDFTTLQPRGTGTVFNRSRLARLLSDGTVDTTFADPGVTAFVLSMAVQPDGAVLVGGDFNGTTSFMGATRNRIARITPAGALDTGFNPNASGPVLAIAQEADGNVLLGGSFGFLSGQSRVRIGRVHGTTGLPLPGLGAPSGAGNVVYSIALQRDGRAVIGGAFDFVNAVPRSRLARLNTDGTLDTSFDPNVTGGDVQSIALQANQKLMIGGSFTAVGGTTRNKVARVDMAGVLDGFNPNVTGGDVLSIALQANGKVQLGGTFTAINGGAAARSSYALLSNETAYQTLEKRSATEVYWSRGGSAPEILSVAFDQATFSGTTFTSIGNGTRVDPLAGDWRLNGISPSLTLSGQIRARARTSGGYLSGSTGIMESKVAYIHSLPVVSTVSVTSITGTTALLTGTVDTSTLSANPAFKLDTTTAYTQPWLIPTPSSVTGTATFTYQVTGLTPGTAYVFRATAENPGGRVDGTNINFTTLSNLHVDYNAGGSDNSPTVSNYTASGRQVSFLLVRSLAPGATLMVVNNTGSAPITGTFANLAQGQAVDLTFGGVTYPYIAHYYGGTGNDLVLLWRNTRAVSWGWNNLSQLGNGNSTNRGIPGDVVPFDLLAEKTIVSLSGGTQHSVALCVDGTLASWGDNLEGQLGNGDTVNRSSTVPTAVEQGFLPAGIHPVAVSAGGSHTLSLFSNGKVYAWGDNQYGQVGSNDAPLDRPLPTFAKGALSGRRVIGISAGEYHSLAVCDDGFVAAWGLGDSGQLGNGNTTNQKEPVAVDLTDVPLGETIIAVAAGRWHSMALTSGGKVFTWGNNSSGQLGDGMTINQSYPILLPGLTATAIYGGGTMHSLALRSDGKLVAWGSNTFGQLGTGTFANSFTPTVVNDTWLSGQSLGNVVAGDEHNLALRSDGTLYAWGLGNEGRLGDNNTGIHTQPVQMPVDATTLDPGDRWLRLSSGAACQHSLGIVAMSLQPAATTYGASPWSATEASLYGVVRAHGVLVDVSFDYGLTSAYGTTVTATPATMNGTTPATALAELSGLLPGTTYHYQVKAVQGGSAFALGGDRTFTTYSRLQMWRDQWFSTLENTGEAANDADADRDGVSNLLEFAFGLDPQQNSLSQLPTPTMAAGQMIYQFTEPTDHMGLTYGAEWSPTMAPGSWLPLPDNGGGAIHIFKLNTAGQPKAFMRLKVAYSGP